MFRIGEFSKLTQVTVRMLRYYDEIGLLKPARTDPWTGYRLYGVDQIPVLNQIVYLRDSGFQTSEIAEAVQNRIKAFDLLEQKYCEIEKNIQEEQVQLRKIETAKQEMLRGMKEMHYNIVVKSIPSSRVLSLRRVIPDYYAEGQLWLEMAAFAAERKLQISNQTFSLYHDADYREQNVDVEVCAFTEIMGEDCPPFTFRFVEEVKLMASTMVYGDFKNIAGAYRSFAQWLQENSQYEMSNPSRQIVHRGPWNEEDPAKYLTEIQIPLAKEAENKL